MVYGTYNYSYWGLNQLITGGPHIAGLLRKMEYPPFWDKAFFGYVMLQTQCQTIVTSTIWEAW